MAQTEFIKTGYTVGLDELTQVPEEVVKDCIYKIGNHYYITNSEKVNNDFLKPHFYPSKNIYSCLCKVAILELFNASLVISV